MTADNNNRKLILISVFITIFFMTYLFSAVNIALPAISREFNPDAILLSWITTSMILVTGVLLIPVGRLSDIFGLKRVFLIGLISYTVVTALCALATSVPMLIALRAAQGATGAMVIGNAIAIVTASFPPGERGQALGLTSASVYVGLTAGPLLGGVLTEYLGWRSIFWVSVPCTLAIIFLFLWKIKDEWKGSPGARFDYPGSVIFCLSFTAFLYGFTVLPDWYGAGLIAGGIWGIWIFYLWEKRLTSPLLDFNLFRNNRTFILSNLASLIAYAATYAVVFLMSLYLQYIKGVSAETTGFILIAQPVMQALLSPLSGRLSDKFEPQLVSSAGMGIICVGLILFAFITADTSIALIVIILVILGIGFGVFVSPNTNAIMSSVAPRFYGIGSSMSATMRQMGQMFSMGISMILLSIFVGKVAITPEYYPSLVTVTRVSFGIFAALCFAGIFASLARGKVHQEQSQKLKGKSQNHNLKV